MSGVSKNPNSIHQNNLKLLAGLNRLTSNRVRELKTRFPTGPNKHLSRGRFRLRSDCIPHFDEWTSFTESLPSPQNYQHQQPGHYQRGNSQITVYSQQKFPQRSVTSQQRNTVQATQQQAVPNTSNATANDQIPAPPKEVNLSVANMLLGLGLTNKNSFNEKELKVLKQQGRLPQNRPSKKNVETNSVGARRVQPQASQQQRRQEEAQKALQAAAAGKQSATKKPVQESATLSSSPISASLAKILLEYENIRKGRKRPVLPKEDDIKFIRKRNKEKEVDMKRPQKRPALKGRGKEKAADLDENIEMTGVKKFIVALKRRSCADDSRDLRGAKRSREGDEVASSKSMMSKKRKTEHNAAVKTQAVQVEAETNTQDQEVQTDSVASVASVAVQTEPSPKASSSNSTSTTSSSASASASASESALANDDIMKMASEAHKRYLDLFKKATDLKRQGDHNENPSDYAEAACYYADAFYEQLIAASLGHNENVVNPSEFMNHVINRFENKDKNIHAAFWGLKALIIKRFFLFEDKRVRPILKDTIIRYNELIETTGRLSEQTMAYKREHYNKAFSESNKIEELINDFTKYWKRATTTYKQLGFKLESDIRFAVDYIRNLLKEWRRDNDSKGRDIKKSASQPKSRTKY